MQAVHICIDNNVFNAYIVACDVGWRVDDGNQNIQRHIDRAYEFSWYQAWLAIVDHESSPGSRRPWSGFLQGSFNQSWGLFPVECRARSPPADLPRGQSHYGVLDLLYRRPSIHSKKCPRSSHRDSIFAAAAGFAVSRSPIQKVGRTRGLMTTASHTIHQENAMDLINKWTTRDIPSQRGRLAIVTGSTQGLGLVVAKALAGAGADVIVPARSNAKGEAAVQQIMQSRPAGTARYELLDLTSLASVRDFAQRLVSQGKPLDLLINNAAVMAPKERQETRDGFELKIQTNHLAPFALTAQLMPLLRMATAPRVTQVSSIAHRDGKIDFDDLQWKARKYNAMASYAQSKLADLMFSFELQRRSDANGWGILSNAAHPGIAVTDLVANSRGQDDMMVRMMKFLGSLMRQSAEDGALPTLYAATSPDARPGTYYGPKNRMETRGPVAVAKPAKQSLDLAVAKKLWDASEELTKISFPTR